MVEVANTTYTHSFPSNEVAITPTTRIPRDVAHKYEVEKITSSESIESLLQKKIVEGTILENEAFYIINLGTVVKKFEEWVSSLPRVKP